ncbi:putative transcription factor WD40-like family [Rosa chinensis]|uniref:Putative transcription factor WD40-like family n=1 Tax=Rosa chinensis TaxID=74649 RepID=A0A2P6Q635_ROSCH|nr:U3 snoRNP-associated protein-like EMB2271 [Rosa chinensis]PRQ29629.1 putative transcription factor WD40-like family [Rosa chinensis]
MNRNKKRGGGGGGGSAPKGGRGGAKKGKRQSFKEDPFFTNESKKRLKYDEDIRSDESSDDERNDAVGSGEEEEEEAAEEIIEETPGEKKLRLTKEYLKRLGEHERKKKEDEDDDSDDDSEKEGDRDSLVAKVLQQQQLQDSGRLRRSIASRVQKPEATDEFRILVKHRQSVTAVVLSDDDGRGFSASKDGAILHWDVDSGKKEKYQWPSDEVLKSHGVKDPLGRATKHSKQMLALAVSSDGRYLASGGLDRHIHLWDTRTRQHVQAFPGHRGPVSCLTFRQGSSELFSGSYDRTVKIWNAEDRTYINTLYGHQGEVLSMDCLRKERLLTVGHDRSMMLFKVPEESRLVFRAPACSLECCSFISNDEFLSGSDNGSVELWTMLRKKPVCIVKNAHPLLAAHKDVEQKDGDRVPNGHIESYDCSSTYSWISSVTSCRGSDLAASGAGNGFVRLWSIESESNAIQPLHSLPVVGFVNSLAIAKSGGFLVAGVGKEPRLGRWGLIPAAQNGVAIHTLKLSSDTNKL